MSVTHNSYQFKTLVNMYLRDGNWQGKVGGFIAFIWTFIEQKHSFGGEHMNKWINSDWPNLPVSSAKFCVIHYSTVQLHTYVYLHTYSVNTYTCMDIINMFKIMMVTVVLVALCSTPIFSINRWRSKLENF